jgi:hypothetical protein
MGKKDNKPTLETEPVILREEFNSLPRKYEVPEVLEYIVEKRNNGETFDIITDKLKERGYPMISSSEVARLYKVAIAKSTLIHNTAQEEFTDFAPALREAYSEAIKILGDYVRNFREINERLKELNADGDLDLLKMKMDIAKQVPEAVKILKEIREFTKFQADLQDKIITEKEQRYSSEADIMKTVTEHFPLLLKELEKDNKISIIDRSILKS